MKKTQKFSHFMLLNNICQLFSLEVVNRFKVKYIQIGFIRNIFINFGNFNLFHTVSVLPDEPIESSSKFFVLFFIFVSNKKTVN